MRLALDGFRGLRLKGDFLLWLCQRIRHGFAALANLCGQRLADGGVLCAAECLAKFVKAALLKRDGL